MKELFIFLAGIGIYIIIPIIVFTTMYLIFTGLIEYSRKKRYDKDYKFKIDTGYNFDRIVSVSVFWTMICVIIFCISTRCLEYQFTPSLRNEIYVKESTTKGDQVWNKLPYTPYGFGFRFQDENMIEIDIDVIKDPHKMEVGDIPLYLIYKVDDVNKYLNTMQSVIHNGPDGGFQYHQRILSDKSVKILFEMTKQDILNDELRVNRFRQEFKQYGIHVIDVRFP